MNPLSGVLCGIQSGDLLNYHFPANQWLGGLQVMTDIASNYSKVKHRIKATCVAAQRSDWPCLLAVSKKHGLGKIIQLATTGHRDFGESYAQEGVEKIKQASDLAVVWHFIGPIQSNKTKLIAEYFDWVQSVDRMKILQRLNQHRPDHAEPLNVLLQVKIGDEATKSGADTAAIRMMAAATDRLNKLCLRGLMCIPPPSDNRQTQMAYFQQAKDLYDELQPQYESMDTLSMGMSNDMEAAILAGSTMVRVGTDIFGPRTA